MMLISSIMLMMVTVVLETTTPAMVFTVAGALLSRAYPESTPNKPVLSVRKLSAEQSSTRFSC
ncbi:hypothetical protein, partial [Ochrobactrum sp. J50]|uniref:hypothetical protein n=1 Tax=Ochrobactrum sp. J50 TaxID=936132 RepID=UPI001AED293A